MMWGRSRDVSQVLAKVVIAPGLSVGLSRMSSHSAFFPIVIIDKSQGWWGGNCRLWRSKATGKKSKSHSWEEREMIMVWVKGKVENWFKKAKVICVCTWSGTCIPHTLYKKALKEIK
jgi:hypothetical protein